MEKGAIRRDHRKKRAPSSDPHRLKTHSVLLRSREACRTTGSTNVRDSSKLITASCVSQMTSRPGQPLPAETSHGLFMFMMLVIAPGSLEGEDVLGSVAASESCRSCG